jgi:hypothetical protein
MIHHGPSPQLRGAACFFHGVPGDHFMWEASPDADYAHQTVYGQEAVIGVWRPLPQSMLTEAVALGCWTLWR